jgi:non-specific serine/threonine protein kinase/serine/threonine-protein kinase
MPPTGPDWARIQSLFDAAADLPAEQRAAYLDRACEGVSELRAEVESLLEWHSRAEGAPLSRAGLALRAAALNPTTLESTHLGRVVGSYRLTAVIGSGGMGVVYRGDHVDARLGQRVAVKLLRIGFRPEDLRRFRDEQRILARLEHPNIARLLDAGVAEDGLPYLIMEYVDGVPLMEYCAQQQLGLAQKLDLFESICAAVEVAHQSQVVHRDLKSSNVLVDRQGRTKLLDFGIAKLLDEGTPPTAELTRTGHHMLTPEYASPEQFRGERATTLSDVYSLGVVLHELLCGRRPYRLDGLSAAEAERVVCMDDPQRPSASGTPDSRRLMGDLDLIALTALAKEPSRRYASVRHLADDLARYRKGMPIHARPDSITYRVGKYVRRNRGALIALVLVLAASLAGVITTARQASETRRRFEQVRALANTLLIEIQTEIRDQPGMTRLRQHLVSRATEQLEGLAQDAARDPALRNEVARAYEQLGELRGDPAFASLGDLRGAIADYRRAESLRRQMLLASPATDSLRHAYAGITSRLALAISYDGDNGGAITMNARALGTLDSLTLAYPHDIALCAEAARVRCERGWFLVWSGQLDEGDAAIVRAAAVFDSLLRVRPDDLSLMLCRATSAIDLADGYKFAKRENDMVAELEPVLAQLQAFGVRYPNHVGLRRRELACLFQLGEAFEVTAPPRALATYQRAIEVAQAQFAVDADNFSTRRNSASAYSHLGGLLLDLKRPAEAIAALERSSREQRWLFEHDRSNYSDASNLSTSLMWMAQSLAKLGRHEDAIAKAQEAVQVRQQMRASLTDDATNAGNLAAARSVLGDAWAGLARAPATPRARAAAAWREALGQYRRAEMIFAGLEQNGRLTSFWTQARAQAAQSRQVAERAAGFTPMAASARDSL